jgi:hypothetical protein
MTAHQSVVLAVTSSNLLNSSENSVIFIFHSDSLFGSQKNSVHYLLHFDFKNNTLRLVQKYKPLIVLILPLPLVTILIVELLKASLYSYITFTVYK